MPDLEIVRSSASLPEYCMVTNWCDQLQDLILKLRKYGDTSCENKDIENDKK